MSRYTPRSHGSYASYASSPYRRSPASGGYAQYEARNGRSSVSPLKSEWDAPSFRVYPSTSFTGFAPYADDLFEDEEKADFLAEVFDLGLGFKVPSRPMHERESKRLVADLRMRAKLIAAIPRRPKRSPPRAPQQEETGTGG